MFNTFCGRPYDAYFERTPRGRERIVVGGRCRRRRSCTRYYWPDEPIDVPDDSWNQAQRLAGENEALRQVNHQLHEQLHRDRGLRRQLDDMIQERDDLQEDVRRLEESERDLERRLDRARERRREERAERQIEQAERQAELEVIETERAERAREAWLRDVYIAELTRQQDRIRTLEDSLISKRNRIRFLEYILRREGYRGLW